MKGSRQDETCPRKAADRALVSTSYTTAKSVIDKLADAKPENSIVTFATPTSDVSAFCRATLSKIVPDGFWGENQDGAGNKSIIMRNINRFVQLRRFENLSLHLVSQGLKVPS